MEIILEVERTFLKKNQKRLKRKYPGKHLLIVGENVCGAFNTYDEGVLTGVTRFPNGPAFLVRSVDSVEDPVLHNPALAIGIPLSCPS